MAVSSPLRMAASVLYGGSSMLKKQVCDAGRESSPVLRREICFEARVCVCVWGESGRGQRRRKGGAPR